MTCFFRVPKPSYHGATSFPVPAMKIQFQDWLVDTTMNQMQRGHERVHLEPLTMNVLAYLLEHADNIVATEELLDRYWSGRHAEPGMVARCVAQIRKALADDTRQPRYVATVRKRGYRAIGPVGEPSASGANPSHSGSDTRPLRGIAVMPFDDLSPQADQAWLADGIAEELTECLGRIRELRVPARTSTAILKAQDADAETIAERLSVGTMLNGSVRCIGNDLTVIVQWIRIADHAHLWSARFERKREDLLELQKEIAVRISESIRKELGIHETAEFASRIRYHTSDVRAWEAFQKGLRLALTLKPEKVVEGREYLQKALEIDPDYLDARAWLAWSNLDQPGSRNQGAMRVLEQQPSNPVALCCLIEDSETHWDFETAEKLWRFAVDNNPLDNLLTLVGFRLLCSLGILDEALEVAKQGVRLDPLWPTQLFFLGLAQMNLGNSAAAIDSICNAISLRVEVGDASGMATYWPYHYLAIAYQFVGRESDAINSLQMGFPRYREAIAEGARIDGWSGANLALIRASGEFPAGHPYRLSRARFKARIFASASEKDLMYGQLSELMDASAECSVRDREAMRNATILSEYLRANAVFEPYREDSEFISLSQQLDDRMAKGAGTSGYADLIG